MSRVSVAERPRVFEIPFTGPGFVLFGPMMVVRRSSGAAYLDREHTTGSTPIMSSASPPYFGLRRLSKPASVL